MRSNKSDRVLFMSILLLLVASLLRLAERTDSWIVDIVSHFPVQYAVVTLLLCIVSIWKKKYALAAFAGIICLLNISAIGGSGITAEAAPSHERPFTIYSANINKTNRDFPRLISELKKADADIMLILEVTEENIEPLQQIIMTYPYTYTNVNVGFSEVGAVFMSKYPIVTKESERFNDYGNAFIFVTLLVNGRKVAIYGTHFPRPRFGNEFKARSKQIVSLAQQISKQTVPVIVAGDLNTSPYSSIFKEFINISGLRDSRSGFGWLPSWPTYVPLMWIPIDHILASPSVYVHKRSTGAYIGSDHYPVFAELSLTD